MATIPTEETITSFVDLLQRPEEDLLSLLQEKNSDPESLRTLCASLFQQVEQYHAILQRRLGKKKKDQQQDDEEPAATLAGLEELYMGEDDVAIDAETLWGQVDLQNDALRTLLRKQVKKLSISTEAIQLLDLGQVLSDNDDASEAEDDSASDEDEKEEDSDEEQVSDDDEEVDEETKNIRARMARTMDNMGDDNDEEDDVVDDEGSNGLGTEDETAVDPDRENMLDGFFDLHEMEAFADEEEEFLPDTAYGEEKPEAKGDSVSKKSFHQRQRDGDLDSGTDEDDDDEDNDLAFSQPLVRRKKYRPDDEVDALFTIYEKPKEKDDDDDVVNMTSADFFGKPNVAAMKRWETEHKHDIDEMDKQTTGDDDDDADSWDNHDFGGEESGWRNEEDGDNDDDERPGNHDDDEEEEDGEEEEQQKQTKPASKMSLKNQRLLQQTKDLEKEMLAEKPWHMIGEAKGMARPMNSLIESTPQFETATKAAPIITVEHTTNIEDIIKRRILNEDWDNVVPRELPDVGWNKKRGEMPEVSQEKSKLGLGELYEREYLKKAVGYDVDAVEKETAETKAKDEMKAIFAGLCSKLDALSNYHFAPRPIADEAEVRAISTPAIAMEEILPLHVSDARGVAPEEVYGAKQGRESILRGDSELTQAERKRLRNSKKAARRKSRKAKLADEKLISKLQPSGVGLSNPYEKRKMREELLLARSRGKVTTGKEDVNSDYGASSQFFQRLQSEIQEGVGAGGDDRKRKRDSEGANNQPKKSSTYKL